MPKIFWFDTETTGVDASKNALVQLAYIVEIDGVVEAKDMIRMRPHKDAIIEAKALEVNKLDPQELWLAPPQEHGIEKLKDVMSAYVDRYDISDKFIQAGYNVGFDDKFLRQAFLRSGDEYYGSWFFWPKLDVAGEIAKWVVSRDGNNFKMPKNFKLETLCNQFNVPIRAHEAMSDIEATRELYYLLQEKGIPNRKST